MKNHDRLHDWQLSLTNANGRQEFYTTYSYDTGLTFILADFYKKENHGDSPDSTTVFSFYHGQPNEEKVLACIARGESHTINF